MRKALGLVVVLLCASGLVLAQGKDKDKDKDKGTKATLVKADVDKKELVVKIDGKQVTFGVTKDVQWVGPKGGDRSKTGLKDDALVPGAELNLWVKGKTLEKVQLPVRKSSKDKDGKDKDKKDKDKK
jgi:hypothetical protein